MNNTIHNNSLGNSQQQALGLKENSSVTITRIQTEFVEAKNKSTKKRMDSGQSTRNQSTKCLFGVSCERERDRHWNPIRMELDIDRRRRTPNWYQLL